MTILLLAAAVLAQAPSRDDQAYLDCYRQTLAAPPFAAMSAAQLDGSRLEIADAVIARCERHMRRQRQLAEERVREASRVGRQMGESALPAGLARALADMALKGVVAGDLNRAEPRMQGLAEAALQARAAEAVRLEADAAGAAQDAARLTAGERISGPAAHEFYERCLLRHIVRIACTDAAEGGVFDSAQSACADVRAALVRQNTPMLDGLLGSDERRLREQAPALVRAIRARGGNAG